MTLSLLTLNSGGCTGALKNASIQKYINTIHNNPNIIFLQESCRLTETDFCWNMWQHTPICSPSPTRGSGITTLVDKTKIDIILSENILPGHILYTQIYLNNTYFHLYNVLIPQNDNKAIDSLQALREHCVQRRGDGVIVIGGDFNCTLDPALDRLRMPVEHRPGVAAALADVADVLSLRDVWRVRNPSPKTLHGSEIIPRPSLAFPRPDSIVFTARPTFFPPSPPAKLPLAPFPTIPLSPSISGSPLPSRGDLDIGTSIIPFWTTPITSTSLIFSGKNGKHKKMIFLPSPPGGTLASPTSKQSPNLTAVRSLMKNGGLFLN